MTASLIVTQTAARAAAQANAAPVAAPSRSDVAEQVRQATEDALEGARAGTEAANRTGRSVTIIRDGHTVRIAPSADVAAGETFTTAPVGGWDGPNGFNDVPPRAENIAYAFFLMMAVMVVGWPIARALGRRIERRGEAAAALTPAVTDQLLRIEQAVDAMAIEVERISESQRFVAKLQRGETAERV
jgi:hypothetical protein